MEISESTFNTIYNAIWRAWREREISYKSSSEHNPTEIFRYCSHNYKYRVIAEISFGNVDYDMISTIQLATFHYASEKIATRTFFYKTPIGG